ncbi:MAG: hypothetical protein A2571_00610 [Candidatus Vogelbacteria bacterium RIFOXYD1_FULL_44_32]|uniref:Uncharacterized protein n=1 Tax=Candidatus Vogelbacteria bacterium RIFOXYD1_FULL_44_32 TaxID=1802438 RepID=A0A1G2QE52_9BACT|nr:MAG: hypothetical protein A2571_00610 [Candidatus Vogelbacteria bacterium RIFOXYD1_FULL_44_32]
MTYQQYTKSIQRELSDINQIIDRKIIHGLSYRRESLRHKRLISELRRRRSTSGWRSLMSFVSLF